jgi:hypothetical protein
VLVAAAALIAAERDRERHLQVLDVAGIDVLELREPPTLVVAVVKQPVVGLLVGVERALVRHVGRPDRGQRGCHEQRTRQNAGESQSFHRILPCTPARDGPVHFICCSCC